MRMGPARDLMFRRPQRTLLPGLGIASAVLAGAVVAIALASSLMGMPLPLEDPPSGMTTPLQIEARVAATESARARATSVRASVAPAVAPTKPRVTVDVATRSVDTSRRLAFEPAPTPRRVPWPPPPTHAATPPPSTQPPPPATPPAAAPPAAPASPLQPLGTGVSAATDGVATTLRTLTASLGGGVAPLSPQLAAVVTHTGDVVANVVQGAGNLLGQILGGPAVRR
jgi:hypothetical protein